MKNRKKWWIVPLVVAGVIFLLVQGTLLHYFFPYLHTGRLIKVANQFERVVWEEGDTGWIEEADFNALRIVDEEVLTADDYVYITNKKYLDSVSLNRITFTIWYQVRVTDDYRDNWHMSVKSETTAIRTITFVFRNFRWYVESVR